MSSIQLYNGFFLDLEAPDPDLFNITDIAHALSNLCRFTGHVERFYSVAQHSVEVSLIVPTLEALLHDATEAFLGDVARPLKQLLPGYKALEDNMWEVIKIKFGLSDLTPEIKDADNVMLLTEQRDVMKMQTPWRLNKPYKPLARTLVPMHPTAAEALFLRRFNELNSKRMTNVANNLPAIHSPEQIREVQG